MKPKSPSPLPFRVSGFRAAAFRLRGSLLPAAALAGALLAASCSSHHRESELTGRGFVHYHPYPDVGQCYCGVDYDFTAHEKMIAAASETIHHFFKDKLCSDRKYVYLTSRSTGKQVRVLIVDKGGQPTDDYNELEQHIMDISIEAFTELDPDGAGLHAGRIYVDWAIEPAN